VRFVVPVAVGLLFLPACGQNSPVKHTGGLGERCNKDGTCQGGLACVADTCRSAYGYGDPVPGDPKGGDPRHDEPQLADPTTGDPGQADGPSTGDPNLGPTCLVGGAPRARNVPQMGDLIVTEIHPDPLGADTGTYREWIELYVVHGPIDLNDLKIVYTTSSTTTKPIVSSDCLAFEAGAYVVVAGQGAVDQGVVANVVITNFSLPNSSSATPPLTRAVLALELGPVALNTVGYPLPAIEGSSYMLKSGFLDVASSETPANWCWAGAPNPPFSGIGSPGEANDFCVPACNDGGTWRAAREPITGGLVITEVYAQPATGTGTDRDWFEVYAVTGPVDLNGITITNVNATQHTVTKTIAVTNCVSVLPENYAVVSGLDAANDGVTPAAAVTSLALYNSASSLKISSGSVDIDTVNYPSPTQGKSYQLEPTIHDHVGNDDAGNWCVAPGANGDYLPFTAIGSPGGANPACL
jgi:hypothetical protein